MADLRLANSNHLRAQSDLARVNELKTPARGAELIVSAPVQKRSGSLVNAIAYLANVPQPGDFGLQEMMAWLTKTMEKTDADLRSQMKAIEARKEDNEMLAATLDLFKSNGIKANEGKTYNIDKKTEIGKLAQKFEADPKALENLAWFKALSPQAQEAVRYAFSDLVEQERGSGHPAYAAETGKWQAAVDAINGQIQRNSSSNEMAMIKLQGAISARGQAIQLVSNILAAFNETSKAIVGNLR